MLVLVVWPKMGLCACIGGSLLWSVMEGEEVVKNVHVMEGEEVVRIVHVMEGVAKVGLHACNGGCGQGWASCLCWWVWSRLGFMLVLVGVAKIGLRACNGGNGGCG